ncbi:hypothetical protein ACQKMK_02135 [Viridibacillus arvi]|uniref:hypothetical protein n=1 Tax=Viridibacillus arvi TaxID=263475 RepID=UPI003CFCD708
MENIRKIYVILLTVSLFLVGGTIYAKGNSSTNLFDWDKHSNLKESDGVLSSMSKNLLTSFGKLKTVLSESVEDFNSEIDSLLKQKTDETKISIKGYQNEHKNHLDKTSAELKDVNFGDYEKNAKVEETVEQDFLNVLQEVLNEE